jgi:hypothetical protein
VFSMYPLPNNPLGPYGGNTLSEILPADGSGQILSAKFDQTFDGNSIGARYNSSDDTSVLSSTGGALFSAIRPRVRTQDFIVNAISNFASLTNSFRFTFGRTSMHFDEVRDSRMSAPTHYAQYPFLLNAPLVLN